MPSTLSISRRTVLRAAGVSLALPWLEATAVASQPPVPRHRFLSLYFPNGCWVPQWWPATEGPKHELSPTLACLGKHQQDLSIVHGLRLERCGNGHDYGDFWLSCSRSPDSQSYQNSVSADYLLTERFRDETPVPSLTLCNDPGVGVSNRSHTQTFDHTGRPIPSIASPRQLFELLFADKRASREERQRAFAVQRSILDQLVESSKRLQLRLGAEDNRKLDEYLSAVRETERQVQQSERWIDLPPPDIDVSHLDLTVTVTDPTAYLDTMNELIVLALRTDRTRVASFIMSREHFGSMQLVSRYLDIANEDHHKLSHDQKKRHKEIAAIDRFFAARFARVLDQLAAIDEGGARLLDRTVVTYGGGNSTTHNPSGLPCIIAGGKELGFSHGGFHKLGSRPLADLWLTILRQFGDEERTTFANSTGPLSELLS